MEYVIEDRRELAKQTCLEPACGRGDMARPLSEYFFSVKATDAFHYGFASVRDFLKVPYEAASHDWVITNPPFRLAEEFVQRSLIVAREGVAILARTVFLESSGRFREIFSKTPPTKFAQFVERVPMGEGPLGSQGNNCNRLCVVCLGKTIASALSTPYVGSPLSQKA